MKISAWTLMAGILSTVAAQQFLSNERLLMIMYGMRVPAPESTIMVGLFNTLTTATAT